MYLEEITGIVQLEGRETECKVKLNREEVVGWLKSVAGFANASGGSLYVGVEDGTNKLMGFEREEADRERNYFNNQLNEHLIPVPNVEISFPRYEVNGKERFIMKITIPESAVKPVILKYKGVPSIFMRRDGYTNGATYEEIIEMSVKSKDSQYDVLSSGKTYDAGNFKALREFYKEHNDGRELSEKALRSIGFYDENGILANGAVMFGDDYDGKKTAVQCSVFSGFNRGSERIVTLNRFGGNITGIIGGMMEFVEQRMNHSIMKLDETRENLDAYPRRALFEGVVNAVVHRDYFLDGTQIQVDMFRDRLEISSPGSFYGGGNIGKTYDLSGLISKRRNELISSILVKCNVMEAAGTGFDKIVEEYADADEKHRPYIFSSSDHFTLVLPDLTYLDGVASSDVPTVVFAPVPDGTEHDGKVLAFCYRRARKASEIAEYLGISDSSYLRGRILGNLEKHGYLEKSKLSKSNYYKTNPKEVRLG